MNTSIINEPQLLVTVSDPTMLTKLKNAIKMMNGVSSISISISIMRPKKTGLELAEEDKAKGRVTQWNSVDEMFDTVLGE
ncbi:hypothetical protein [Leyella stercorea]|uniref:hypothetical protein n=1 Tax=Leyella stercorea TaxID=363265 RepID=UPI00242FE162|nr:hypothetical protein [Leyella stercorea]